MKRVIPIVLIALSSFTMVHGQALTQQEVKDLKIEIQRVVRVFGKYHSIIGSGKEQSKRVTPARMQHFIYKAMQHIDNEKVMMEFGVKKNKVMRVDKLPMRTYLERLGSRAYTRQAWFEFKNLLIKDIDLHNKDWTQKQLAWVTQVPVEQHFSDNNKQTIDTTKKIADILIRVTQNKDKNGKRVFGTRLGDIIIKDKNKVYNNLPYGLTNSKESTPLAVSTIKNAHEIQDIKIRIKHLIMNFRAYHNIISRGQENGKILSANRVKKLIDNAMRYMEGEQSKMILRQMRDGATYIYKIPMREYLQNLASGSYDFDTWFELGVIKEKDIELKQASSKKDAQDWIIKVPVRQQRYITSYVEKPKVKLTSSKELEVVVKIYAHLHPDKKNERLLNVKISSFLIRDTKYEASSVQKKQVDD